MGGFLCSICEPFYAFAQVINQFIITSVSYLFKNIISVRLHSKNIEEAKVMYSISNNTCHIIISRVWEVQTL